MIRRAFIMKLKPDSLATYKKHHDEIWGELVAEIEKSGIAEITIFENDPVLVLYSVISNVEAWDHLWHSEGIVNSTELREVFHLETKAGK